MGLSDEWRDIKYREIFEQELRGLERRLQLDPSCTKEDLGGILNNLYISDGADWGGRGEIQDVIMAATIAAYEFFISELR
jgi:hypothetical protein